MSEGYRDCFVGEKGYDALKKSMKAGNDLSNEIAKYLQERNDAELIYVRALRKIGTNFEKLATKTKGTVAQALVTLATQTNKEADAHSLIADKLLNELSIPIKNLADTQAKQRKSIEESLNLKLKDLNNQKDIDNKYRSRQFSQCREIENLAVKISEASSSGSKASSRSKTSTVSSPSVLACVLPASRYSSASEKLESSIKKAEEELERTEEKYHSATRYVELLRQNFDAELCRSCDQLQKMETDRLADMSNCIRTYATSIQTLTETMHQITQDLYAITINPENDILVQVKSCTQPAEIEILLYDIYAENKDNEMNEQRRVLNLMNWMARLKKDIEIQQRTKTNGIVRNSIRQNDESSPSDDDDDDGGMYRAKKKEKKKSEASNERVSSEVFVDRQGAALLEELYRASLYKIEYACNRIKNLPKPNYEYADRITHTFMKDGTPTTLLRLPCQPPTRTPPSAPTAVQCFAASMPTYQPVRKLGAVQKKEPPSQIGWNVPYPQAAEAKKKIEHFVFPAPQPMLGAYPVLSAQAPPPPTNHVRVLHQYSARHKDELNLQPGDVIVLLNRRNDNWCEGELNGRVGLFPGNYVKEC